MKKLLLYLIAVFMLFSSCNDFYFKSPQPQHGKKLSAIPDELIGTYMEKKSDQNNNPSKHPLIITRNSYRWEDSDSVGNKEKISGTLTSGKVVLKKLEDYYVLSQKVENPINTAHDSVWEVYVLEYQNNQLLLYNLTSEERMPKVDSVKHITPVIEEKEGDSKFYLINPSRKQFKKLLDNDLFKKTGEFEKVK